jgi:hypothetical protein
MVCASETVVDHGVARVNFFGVGTERDGSVARVALTWEEAVARVGAPGSPFELVEDEQGRRRFKNAPPNMRSLFDLARDGGDEIFLVYEDERWSFNEVFGPASTPLVMLSSIATGIRKGDRVAIGMRNYPEWVMSMLAIVSCRRCLGFAQRVLGRDELEYALDDCGATLLIADDERIARDGQPVPEAGCADARSQGEDASADDVEQWTMWWCPARRCRRSMSGGTTTQPSSTPPARQDGRRCGVDERCGRVVGDGVRQSGDGRCRARRGGGCQTAERSNDVHPHRPAVPRHRLRSCVLGCVISKAKLVMMYRWNAEKALELIERERGHQLRRRADAELGPGELAEVRRVRHVEPPGIGGGGAPAPPALVERVAGSFKGGGPTLGYGMTETNAYGRTTPASTTSHHPTSTGRVMPILRIEIRDPDRRQVPVGGAWRRSVSNRSDC